MSRVIRIAVRPGLSTRWIASPGSFKPQTVSIASVVA
jgi:hypothetical protein